MSDEISRAAHKQRERKKALKRKKAEQLAAKNDPRRQMKYRKMMVIDALAGKGGERLAVVMIGVVLLGVTVLGVIFLDKVLHGWTPVVLPVPMIASMIGAYFATDRVVAYFARKELGRVRRGFEVGSYLEQLSDNRSNAVVVFRLQFSPQPEGKRRAEIADATREWMKELATVEWQRDVLVAKTTELDCHLMIQSKYSVGDYEWSNRAVHSAVAHFIRCVLPHLDNVTKLDVDIEGEVRPWDAD